MTLAPPASILEEVFSQEVRAKWRGRCNRELRWRLNVLNACGPWPSYHPLALDVRGWRAWKAAWDTYLSSAWQCGAFEGDQGRNLLGRLRSRDPADFRGAMAECLTTWFLAGKIHLSIQPNLGGRAQKLLELGTIIEGKIVGVEVKAPYRARPDTTWSGGESDKISDVLKQANKQFDDCRPNMLVIVPELRVPIREHREYLLQACFGTSVYRGEFNPNTGRAENFKFEFDPTGKFFRTARPDGRRLKPDGFPGYRRVSALLCIEEVMTHTYPMPNYWGFSIPDANIHAMLVEQMRHYLRLDNQTWIDHAAIVVHNPYALHPLSSATWDEFPQFVFDDKGIGEWTDGKPVNI